MLITCPFCGERPHAEFVYGGDALVRRPADPGGASDERWFDYLYVRDNPRGPHRELWHHVLGCDQWIEVRRDTLTHAIGETAPVRAQAERGRA
jgi:heterotetrameric sarcosine oxidase delta subunit